MDHGWGMRGAEPIWKCRIRAQSRSSVFCRFWSRMSPGAGGKKVGEWGEVGEERGAYKR